jgi:imidazoleglycerol-phosphate dehydratase
MTNDEQPDRRDKVRTQPREASVERKTLETEILVTLALEGSGRYSVATGIGFLDHILAHVAVHGLLDLTVRASGDLHVDAHHTVEDVALTLGQALDQALGDRSGITRVGSAYVPMDETLAFVAIDLSGRPYGVTEVPWSGPTVGGLPVTLIPHFFESFSVTARANVHARVLYGRDDHHKAEALFKALGRALNSATRLEPRLGGAIPSTKESLGA